MTGNSIVRQLQAVFEHSEFSGRVYLVGGYVRDSALGVEPVDIDLMVLGQPDAGTKAASYLARRLKIYSPGSNPVIYPRFGTALVRLTDGTRLEFIAARAEADDEGDVLFAEARLRDFTVNALMQDLASGQVIDPTGLGIRDLEERRLRTPAEPGVTFAADPLRLVRAVRFALSYSLRMDLSLLRSIRSNAFLVREVSAERIRDEFNRLMLLNRPSRAIRLLKVTGLLHEILPELVNTIGVTQNRYHDRDVFGHSLAALDASPARLRPRLATLFHDIGKVSTRTEINGKVQFIGHAEAGASIVRRLMRRLKYRNSDLRSVATIVTYHMDLKAGGPDSSGLKDRHLRLFIHRMGELLEDALDTIHADNVSHAANYATPEQVKRIRERIATWDLEKYMRPELPVDGNDLLVLGLSGPRVGKVLHRITRRFLEHDGLDRETALRIARDMAATPGRT